jgi:hypothetical protein
MKTRDSFVLLIGLLILGIALLICLGGVIFLAAQQPPAAIPDVLIATTGIIVGAIAGLLVPGRSSGSARETADLP